MRAKSLFFKNRQIFFFRFKQEISLILQWKLVENCLHNHGYPKRFHLPYWNKKSREQKVFLYFREAAVNVTRITTGYEPHPKQPVYGARSLDLVFGLDATRSR